MKIRLRLISALIVLSMIFPLLSGIIQPVFAADFQLNVYTNQAADYNAGTGTLKLRWEYKPNITAVTIKYHIPDSDPNQAREMIVPQEQIDLANNVATITNLQNDIIYDFEVTLENDIGQTFSGKLYFLPKVSVSADPVEQQPVSVDGGGVETGVYPAIKLSWKVPRIYNSSEDKMDLANTTYPNNPLNGLDITRMEFVFNLLSKDPDTNRDALANVEIKMNPGQTDPDLMYKAVVSGETDPATTSEVRWDAVNETYSFYILGLKDDVAAAPSKDDILTGYDDTGAEVLPEQIMQANDYQYVLLHPEVRPGSIYVITMDTWFYDINNHYSDAVLFGILDSPLDGPVNYVYTYIRFQLTKDSQDNVYVRIYRVNSGDVNMPDLYYQIQTSTVPSTQDSSWTTRRTLHDDNFPEEADSTIDIIKGINPSNTVYYRIIVKSDAVSDKIKSDNLPYKMQEDMARPPVPKNISVIDIQLERQPAAQGEKTSNITISWDKPSNWDQIMNDPDHDVYFNMLLNIDPKELNITPVPTLEADGKTYGQHPVRYRLVKSINAHQVTQSADGSKLIYTLNGLDLFQWVDEQGYTYDIPMPADDTDYPKYLLPNKTYYLQMYTSLVDKNDPPYIANVETSDKSLIESFTTLSPTGKDVPTPQHLELVEAKVNAKPDPANASVTIRFDDQLTSQIDWSDYTTNPQPATDKIIYELYMCRNTELNNFQNIDSLDAVDGDVDFDIQTINNTTWVYATINQFTGDNATTFGTSLSPNTTYYFMVKVKLEMTDDNGNPAPKWSLGTVILPVTIPRGEPTNPDDDAKKPLAPIDFAIATDSNGDLMLTGESVTFEWTVQEDEAAYNMIATGGKVEADTPEDDSSIIDDPVYDSFINAFGNKDGNVDGRADKFTLDPNAPPLPGNFTYDSATKKCRYTIDTWLYPNRVYYFTLRSEITDPDGGVRSSVWVSIPVTTSLIAPPSMLQVVNDCELAFYWYDTTPGLTTDNYRLMLKAAGDKDYTQLTRSQYTIVKDGSIYYGRVLKLKPETQYNIKVIRTTDSKEINAVTMSTRDDYHQIDVKWQGSTIDPYSGFQIAIRTEDDSDYTVLDNKTDLEQYFDTTTQTTYPYYIEKSNSNLGTNYYTYNARIKLGKDHAPLKPNTKYYIKVRAVKYDSSNINVSTASKYIGPVNTRTEFNQDDYDDEDNNTSVTAQFLDMLDRLEQELYWGVAMKNGVVNKYLIKDEKVTNLLQVYGNFSCTIDISLGPDYVYNDEIYMAKDILKAMKANNKSVTIKAKNVEYTIRPDTFDIDVMEEYKSAGAANGSKDVYLKVNNILNTSAGSDMPKNVTAASKMYTLTVQAVASRQTSTSINALIKDKLYNDKTGIIQEKIATIKDPSNTHVKGDAKAVEEYLNSLIEEIKSELSFYLEDTLNGSSYSSGIFADKYNVSKFSSTMMVKMPYTSKSMVNPYVVYGNSGNWQKLTQNLKKENGYISYLVSGTGKYAIFSSKDIADTISGDNAAKPYLDKLAAEYDLNGVFPGADVSFNPNLSVTVREAVLMYELLTESGNDPQKEVKTKAKEYGIDKIINTANIYRNITRQETAALVTKYYCEKTGVDYNKLRAIYSGNIKDDNLISDRYAVPVYLSLQMNFMTLDLNGKFNPDASVSRAELIIILGRMLEA